MMSRVFVLGVMLTSAVLSAPLCHCQTAEASPAVPLTEAREFFKKHQWKNAEELLNAYLQQNPHSAEALYLLGQVLEGSNRPKEALVTFNKAVVVRKPTAEEVRVIALNYVLLGDYRGSVHWLERSLEMDDHNSETWYDLARSKMMLGDYIGAQPAMEKALAINPKMVKAENNLGLILEAQNRTAEAAEAYRLAVEWQRSDPHPSEQPLLNYGTLLIDQQRSKEALPLLEQAVIIAPGNAKCHEQLARAFEREGEPVHAIGEMKTATSLDPENPRLHFQLGQLYRRVGEQDKARDELMLSQKLYGARSSEATPQ